MRPLAIRQYNSKLLLGRIACMKCKDAADCYRCSVACVSVRVCVGYNHVLSQNGRTDRDAVWGVV